MFWPGRGEALSRTIEAEAAISDLYAEAFRRWAPDARAAVLPTLTGHMVNGDPALVAAALPPDPDALAQTQSAWQQHADEVILAGLAVIWAAAVYQTVSDLGGGIIDTVEPVVDTAVLGIVLASLVGMRREEVLDAVGYVDAHPELAAARDDYLATKRDGVYAAPSLVHAKVEAALSNMTTTVERPAVDAATPDAPEPTITVEVIPETRPEVLRARAAEVLEASSPEMRDVARGEGYQAAEVLNNAVIAAAQMSDDADELQKVWICTIDGKTRPSHWAGDGQRVPLNGYFTIGGEQLFVPGDRSASPAEWKNCRCRVGVLAADEEIPDEVDRHTERLDGRDSVAINRNGRTQAEEIERRREAGNVRARDDEDGIGRVASGGWTAPSEQEYSMGKTATATLASEDEETFLTFSDALFAVTGTPTSDGRMLAADIELTMRETPLPLQWCEEMEGGHYGSVTVGVIESITYSNGEVRASGYMLNNENALKAIDLVSHGVNNPSVDLANVEWVATDEKGNVVTEETYEEGMAVYMTVTKAELTATTIVAIPAFGQTRIALNSEREVRAKALVASAAAKFTPRVYDAALFSDPKLTGPTPLSIDQETGRIFGHVACWSERHRSVGLGDITPPRSPSGYEHFHSSPPVHLSDGTKLPVGRLTVGIGHAPTSGVSNDEAQAHYDNVEACFALVRAGEDAYGVWVSGVPAPWATPEKIEMGLAAPLSGDWRPYGGQLDLVAVLAVNTPGFLCRGATDSYGKPLAMVASLAPARTVEMAGGATVTLADIKAAVAEALAESARTAERVRRAEAALMRARTAVGDPPPPPTTEERLAALLERV